MSRKLAKHFVSIDVLAALDCIGAVVEFGDFFRRQLDYFLYLYRSLFHDVPNGTSADAGTLFASDRVSHRFVCPHRRVLAKRWEIAS